MVNVQLGKGVPLLEQVETQSESVPLRFAKTPTLAPLVCSAAAFVHQIASA